MNTLALLPVLFETPRGLEVLGLVFCIWMLVECWKREPNSMEKFGWIALILFIPIAGPLIYFFLRVVKIRG